MCTVQLVWLRPCAALSYATGFTMDVGRGRSAGTEWVLRVPSRAMMEAGWQQCESAVRAKHVQRNVS